MELTTEQQAGYVTLVGQLVFPELTEPKLNPQYPDSPAKYSLQLKFPKEGEQAEEQMDVLEAVINHVGEKTWGDEAESKLDQVWGAIENGIAPKYSPISLQDGDLHNPEYNGGNWVLGAKRRADSGRPALITQDGHLCFNEQGELQVDHSELPGKYDGVVLVIQVWAQAKFDRINFTIEAVRKAVASGNVATQPPNPAIVSGLAGASLPTSIAGVGEVPQVEAGTVSEPDPSSEAEPAPAKRRGRAKTKAVEVEVVEEGEPKKARTSLFRK